MVFLGSCVILMEENQEVVFIYVLRWIDLESGADTNFAKISRGWSDDKDNK